MQTATSEEKEVVLLTIRELVEKEESLLTYARDAVSGSVKTFVDEKIGKLFGLASVYKQAFERLQVQNKNEMDRKIRMCFRLPEIRESCDDWHELEHEWDTLLQDVDRGLDDLASQPLTQGQNIPMDLPLIDARTGENVSLQNFIKSGTNKSKQSDAESSAVDPPSASPSTSREGAQVPTLVLVLLRHFA